MSIPDVQLPYLPPNTIVPEEYDYTFIQYFNRIYEDIAFAVNARDFVFFTIPIDNKYKTIPNLPLFGSFFILVSGETPGLPCVTTVVNKADIYQKGFTSEIAQQDGNVAPWNTGKIPGGGKIGLQVNNATGANIPSTGEIAIQIRHDGPDNLIGNFNIRLIGTQ
jgi:hypothetical protein